MGSDCANLFSGVTRSARSGFSFAAVPSGLCSGLHRSRMSQAMGMCGILVRPWLTSLFHTVAICLAKCTSCSTKAGRANEIPPQSFIASSMAILASPVPSKRDSSRATSCVTTCGYPLQGSGSSKTLRLFRLSDAPDLICSPLSRRNPACNHVPMAISAILAGHPAVVNALLKPDMVPLLPFSRMYWSQMSHRSFALHGPSPHVAAAVSGCFSCCGGSVIFILLAMGSILSPVRGRLAGWRLIIVGSDWHACTSLSTDSELGLVNGIVGEMASLLSCVWFPSNT